MTRLVLTFGLLVSLVGCSHPARNTAASLVPVAFAYFSMAETSPEPVSPTGCVEDCTCKGTGEERSGDGLAIVACRCPEACACKARPEPQEGPQEPDSPPGESPAALKATPGQNAPQSPTEAPDCESGQCPAPPPTQTIPARRGLLRWR